MPTGKLMCIFAHPDDETLATGGTLSKYAAEGFETSVITATRGEYGWFGAEEEYPGLSQLGKIREAELQEACHILGVRHVVVLDYLDGHLNQALPADVIKRLVCEIRRLQPEVVITFDPFGSYGHPDHIAISQLATAAVMQANDPAFITGEYDVHSVQKLYYTTDTTRSNHTYQQVFGDLIMQVEGVERRSICWPEWSLSAILDTSSYADQVWRAIRAHKTQTSAYVQLEAINEAFVKNVIGFQTFYRVFSLVDVPQDVEEDLFAGLR